MTCTVFEVGGIGLGERRWRRDDGAEHLETVVLGEIAERLVVGHQQATIGRERAQERTDVGIGRGDRGLVVGEAGVDATGVEPDVLDEVVAKRRQRGPPRASD